MDLPRWPKASSGRLGTGCMRELARMHQRRAMDRASMRRLYRRLPLDRRRRSAVLYSKGCDVV